VQLSLIRPGMLDENVCIERFNERRTEYLLPQTKSPGETRKDVNSVTLWGWSVLGTPKSSPQCQRKFTRGVDYGVSFSGKPAVHRGLPRHNSRTQERKQILVETLILRIRDPMRPARVLDQLSLRQQPVWPTQTPNAAGISGRIVRSETAVSPAAS
jgi:hypothetical protein